MKTIFLKVIFAATVMLVSGVTLFKAQKSEALSDIALANVEALADEEWYDGNCYWSDWQYILCYENGPIPLGCPCGSRE